MLMKYIYVYCSCIFKLRIQYLFLQIRRISEFWLLVHSVDFRRSVAKDYNYEKGFVYCIVFNIQSAV